MSENAAWADLMATITDSQIETPARKKAEELLASAPLVLASRNGSGATELGLMCECLTAKSYYAIRDAVAAEIDRPAALAKSFGGEKMNMATILRVRELIADEIRGCSFDFEDKQGALERAEGIIVALETAGMTIVSNK